VCVCVRMCVCVDTMVKERPRVNVLCVNVFVCERERISFRIVVVTIDLCSMWGETF